MKKTVAFIKRNIQLFFKDKAMFFTSLMTPMVLLVLYVTFLKNVYYDSFTSSIPEGIKISEKLINGLVGGELISSLLAVSSVTVSFSANLIMVQDKITGAVNDIMIAPVKSSAIAIGYYISAFIIGIIISAFTALAGFGYLAVNGWFLSVSDVFMIFLDIFLLVLFGTVMSSIVCIFISTQGQMSAAASIISAGYGFICGAYMPISNFGTGLQNVLSLLPGTYGTALLHNHAMNGALEGLKKAGVPSEAVREMAESVDCNVNFFGDKISSFGVMYTVLAASIVLLLVVYILINRKKWTAIK